MPTARRLLRVAIRGGSIALCGFETGWQRSISLEPNSAPHPRSSTHGFIEYRIPLPMTVEEFERAQLYMIAQKSLATTGKSGGVEWLSNMPFDNTDGHWGVSAITGVVVPRTRGQYTLKRYHLKSKLPTVVCAMMPSSASHLVEESWNSYPHTRTVIVSPYFDHDKFHIVSVARGIVMHLRRLVAFRMLASVPAVGCRISAPFRQRTEP